MWRRLPLAAASFACGAVLAIGTASATPMLGAANNFTVLGLEDGKVIINSATEIIGNVGYADGVSSPTNQKVDSFDGTAFVHSGASFTHTPATYAPTGGIKTGTDAPGIGPFTTTDALLDQAHLDALAASAYFAGLSTDITLAALGDNDSITVTRVDSQTVIALPSLTYKEDALTLVGGASDLFVFNVAGDFNFSNSQIVLSGVNPDNVVFNFPNVSDININKAGTSFSGTILAPQGVIDYHNPATLNGRLIADDITLHSDFRIAVTSFFLIPPVQAPEPRTLTLFGVGLAAAGWLARRKRRT